MSKERLSDQIFHFPTNEKPRRITKEEYLELSEAISRQWEEESHELGKWMLPVLDWSYTSTGGTIQLDRTTLSTGEEVPLNVSVTRLIGDEVYGPCFLMPFDDKLSMVEEMC